MHIEPFDELTRSLLDEINRHGTLVTFEKGAPCMQGDDLGEHFYIILNGRMKVFEMNLESGREQTLFILKRGDMFDTVSLLDGRPHDVMTEALDPLKAIALPMKEVRGWVRNNLAFNRLLLPYVAKQMRSLETLSVNLSLYDTSERLIRLIIDNLDPETRSPELINGLSHGEIASMIGSVRQVLERHLQTLQKEGLIEVGRKTLLVKNLQRLKERIRFL